MTDSRRELILKCIDGDQRLLHLMHAFTMFYRCDEMLQWLIVNKLTGLALYDWSHSESFAGSYFQTAKFVLTKVKREKELQAVIGGKDFITTRRV